MANLRIIHDKQKTKISNPDKKLDGCEVTGLLSDPRLKDEQIKVLSLPAGNSKSTESDERKILD